MRLLGACVAALAAALGFACSAVLQQRAAREVPEDEPLGPRMIARLVRQRAWLGGVGMMVAAYGLQALALGLGPVAIVEPLVAGELVFAVPIAVRIQGRRPGPREWAGIFAVVAGVGAFLVCADPRGGTAQPSAVRWLIGFGPWLVVAGALVWFARGPETPRRAGLLAAASGATFGMLSLVTKSAVAVLTHGGLLALVEGWQPELLVLLGVGGFLVGQRSYQAAPLATSLPVMDSTEPVSAVLLATSVMGEQLGVSAGALAGEATGALVALLGLFLLGRSPLVLSLYQASQRRKRREGRRSSRRPSPPQEAVVHAR